MKTSFNTACFFLIKHKLFLHYMCILLVLVILFIEMYMINIIIYVSATQLIPQNV